MIGAVIDFAREHWIAELIAAVVACFALELVRELRRWREADHDNEPRR